MSRPRAFTFRRLENIIIRNHALYVLMAATVALTVTAAPTAVGSFLAGDDVPVPCRDPDDPGRTIHVVDVFSFGYSDTESGRPVIDAAVGDRVCFRWTDGFHTVTSGVAGQSVAAAGPLDSPAQGAGSYWKFDLDDAGEFVFTCRFHATMNGILRASAS